MNTLRDKNIFHLPVFDYLRDDHSHCFICGGTKRRIVHSFGRSSEFIVCADCRERTAWSNGYRRGRVINTKFMNGVTDADYVVEMLWSVLDEWMQSTSKDEHELLEAAVRVAHGLPEGTSLESSSLFHDGLFKVLDECVLCGHGLEYGFEKWGYGQVWETFMKRVRMARRDVDG